jgi:hypothetical protein
MDAFFRYWLKWPSLEIVMALPWAWPLCETFHFIGLSLLVGIVGTFDLRLLGVAKGLPVEPLRRLLPWGVFGFVLCGVTGGLFVLGLGANLPDANAFDVIMTDFWLQLKLLFILLGGLNLLAFHLTGTSRAVEALGPGDDAPGLAKAIAGTSLLLWLSVVVFGRLIPRELY